VRWRKSNLSGGNFDLLNSNCSVIQPVQKKIKTAIFKKLRFCGNFSFRRCDRPENLYSSSA